MSLVVGLVLPKGSSLADGTLLVEIGGLCQPAIVHLFELLVVEYLASDLGVRMPHIYFSLPG